MKKFRKPHRIKQKKSIFKNRFLGLVSLTLIIGLLLFYFLFLSSFFQIKEIKISGNEKVEKRDIENLIQNQIIGDSNFFRRKNVWLVNLEKINKSLLENFPQFAKVSIKKDFPDKISFSIEERKPLAVFLQDENYFFIDGEGIIFEKVEQEGISQFLKILTARQLKEIKLGEKIIEKELVSKISEINSKIAEELKIPIEAIFIVSEERLNVKTLEGFEVYFNPKEDLNWQLIKLKAVLEKKIPLEKRGQVQYIDLRFEKVYIFPETDQSIL